MANKNITHNVREHYENLPYPERLPEDEKKRLLHTGLDSLDRINHYCFKGQQCFNENFRVLVAGGGTGDAIIYLAEQLRDKKARIVYLDLSTASMAIAKERARIRKLDNIEWVNASILEQNFKSLGEFDYINCSGVLHHLEDPLAGLNILKNLLAPNGVLAIMVYAKYGRTAIYQTQELIRMVNSNATSSIQEEVNNAWKILSSLPQTNWLKRSEGLHTDHERYGDIGLYDLFLHKQDRAYSIPELFDWLNQADLNFIEFSSSKSDYDPRCYIKDQELLQSVLSKNKQEQYAISEIISGAIIKHSFYCGKNKNTIADLTEDSILVLSDSINQNELSKVMISENIGKSYTFQQFGIKFSIDIDFLVCIFFSHLDRKHSIKEISYIAVSNIPQAQFSVGDAISHLMALSSALIEIDQLYIVKRD